MGSICRKSGAMPWTLGGSRLRSRGRGQDLPPSNPLISLISCRTQEMLARASCRRPDCVSPCFYLIPAQNRRCPSLGLQDGGNYLILFNSGRVPGVVGLRSCLDLEEKQPSQNWATYQGGSSCEHGFFFGGVATCGLHHLSRHPAHGTRQHNQPDEVLDPDGASRARRLVNCGLRREWKTGEHKQAPPHANLHPSS